MVLLGVCRYKVQVTDNMVGSLLLFGEGTGGPTRFPGKPAGQPKSLRLLFCEASRFVCGYDKYYFNLAESQGKVVGHFSFWAQYRYRASVSGVWFYKS